MEKGCEDSSLCCKRHLWTRTPRRPQCRHLGTALYTLGEQLLTVDLSESQSAKTKRKVWTPSRIHCDIIWLKLSRPLRNSDVFHNIFVFYSKYIQSYRLPRKKTLGKKAIYLQMWFWFPLSKYISIWRFTICFLPAIPSYEKKSDTESFNQWLQRPWHSGLMQGRLESALINFQWYFYSLMQPYLH